MTEIHNSERDLSQFKLRVIVIGLVVLHVLVRRACAWAGMAPLAHTAQASA